MFWHRLVLDFWPPDSSRVAPNLVASSIAFAAGAGVAWAVKGRRVLAELHAKLDAHHQAQLDAHAATRAQLPEAPEGPA